VHPDPAKISVTLPDAKYDVLIRPGSLANTGDELRRRTNSSRIAIVTDAHLADLHLPALEKSLTGSGFDVIKAVLPAGESHKTLRDCLPVYDAILRRGIDRATPIVGFGGGVVTDMAGFVAATILRGVPLVQMPTTLLAMVDASVGGKTGVNHAVGKNLIGAFYQPTAVLIDPAVLKTLPLRELRGGLAECIKHDIIRDAEGFTRLEREIDKALALDVDYLADLVAHNVRIKARVVEADPFEHGERAHLNFGHTFGHAIETVSRYEYSHGESVALGMVAAANLAVELKMLDDPSRKRIVALIEKAGLPARGLALALSEVVDAMAFDKKVKSGKLRFVIPDRIGNVVVRDDVPIELVRRSVESLR
jgi:3-dehydroquinate synthase